MLFNSATFLVFLAVVYLVHRMAPASRWPQLKLFLLAASYAFYGWFEPAYCLLLALSTAVDWACGRWIATRERGRRAALATSVTVNLGLLGFFKYGDFVLANVAWLAGWRRPGFEIVLPIGISFYTFQSMSYTIDLYRRRLEPFRRFTDFALFVSFFPQLVAGPIVRATEFAGQLARKRPLRWPKFSWGVHLIVLGFFHKAVLADNLAALVDPYFAEPWASAPAAWSAVYAFAFQIYCDFAGYTWIAIGVAHLFGFRFPRNFDHPYLATSFRDFWHRWHVTLSRFLRDYLYVPLGGNRRGRLVTLRNLMVTMALGGLWHGAAWTFVAWGVLHGLYLAVERVLPPIRVPSLLRAIVVFHAVCLGWVLFRAPSIDVAGEVAATMVAGPWDVPFEATSTHAYLGLAAAIHLLPLARRGRRRLPSGWYLVANAAMLLAILRLRAESQAFLYFQF